MVLHCVAAPLTRREVAGRSPTKNSFHASPKKYCDPHLNHRSWWSRCFSIIQANREGNVYQNGEDRRSGFLCGRMRPQNALLKTTLSNMGISVQVVDVTVFPHYFTYLRYSTTRHQWPSRKVISGSSKFSDVAIDSGLYAHNIWGCPSKIHHCYNVRPLSTFLFPPFS